MMTIQVQEFLLAALEMPMKIQTTQKIIVIPKRTTMTIITSTVRIIKKVQIAL
jgi:hypothetical protein